MRLIDAELLKGNCKITGDFENNFQCVDLATLGCVIDNQPTAYDVDKVVEQLSCNECKFCKLRDVCNANMLDGFMEKIREIVKGGGANGN